MEDAVAQALVAELGKKTSVSWVRYSVHGEPPTQHPVWHVWHDGALLLVSGGSEQPLPDIEAADRVEVTMRSKDNGGRLVTWVGSASRILPTSAAWDEAAPVLATARLSIPSLTETPKVWAVESVVTQIVPTGELVEPPGSLPESSLAAPPKPTRAITRGTLPRVLHRRKSRGPRLS